MTKCSRVLILESVEEKKGRTFETHKTQTWSFYKWC